MRWTVRAATPDEYFWLRDRTQCAMTEGFKAIACVDDAGVIHGMVGYDGWTENACQAHMAVDTPMAWRAMVRPAFEYPFLQAGKSIMLGLIPASNARSVQLAKRLGLREVYRISDGWAVGEDLLVLELRKTECRWLS